MHRVRRGRAPHIHDPGPSRFGRPIAQAREGMNVTVTGIGPDAVSNSCVAACHARLYLEVRRGPRTCAWLGLLAASLGFPPGKIGMQACVGTGPARLMLRPPLSFPHIQRLQEDNLDIRAIPLFEEVEKDSKDGTTHTMTALKLKILVEHVTS